MDGSLYEQDFYLWTQHQADAIAAAGCAGASNTVEWDRVAEEVRDLGASQLRECESRARTIVEHLFKIAWTGQEAPKAGWRRTIRVQRADLELAITASIEKILSDRLERIHLAALSIAEASFADAEPTARVDSGLRWTLDQVLGRRDDPLAGG